MSELRKLTVDGREILWVLLRKKVKMMHMHVKLDGIVYISASRREAIEYIENFIRKYSDYIFSHLDRYSVFPLSKVDKKYQNGDTIRYFDTDYTLSIIISPIEDVKISGKFILAAVKNEERTGLVLKKFYADEIAKVFADFNKRTYEMFRAKGYNVPFAELQIKAMTSHDGVCYYDKGKIVMSSRLALYPEVCTAYIFIHEYAHFIVPNHSKDFYAVVRDLMPDYKTYDDMLKK